MRFLFYIIVIAIVIILGIYFINPGLFKSIQNTISHEISDRIPIESLSNKTTIYKWKNKKGELQISNSPPPDGIKYTTEKIQHNTNIMPSEALTGKSSNN